MIFKKFIKKKIFYTYILYIIYYILYIIYYIVFLEAEGAVKLCSDL